MRRGGRGTACGQPPGGWAAARPAVAVIAAAGLALGVLTRLGQGSLPGSSNWLANSGAVWLASAFVVGSLMATARWAVAAGTGTLLGALLGYYVAVMALNGFAGTLSGYVFWTAIAVVGGPTFGLAGRWWRHGERPQRIVAIALLGAAMVADGVHLLAVAPDPVPGWVGVGAGLAMPLLLGRSTRERALSFVGLAPCLALGLAAFGVMDAVNAAMAGV